MAHNPRDHAATQTAEAPAIIAHPPVPPLSSIAQLEAERAAHLREMEELRAGLLEQPEIQVEEGDPTISEQAKNMTLLSQIEEHVAQIDRALLALRQGTYGVCEECGEPIDPERLRAVPETRLCVRCKSKREKVNHHRR